MRQDGSFDERLHLRQDLSRTIEPLHEGLSVVDRDHRESLITKKAVGGVHCSLNNERGARETPS
jgi:hypothetical protein